MRVRAGDGLRRRRSRRAGARRARGPSRRRAPPAASRSPSSAICAARLRALARARATARLRGRGAATARRGGPDPRVPGGSWPRRPWSSCALGPGAAPFVAWEVARDHNHCFGSERLPAKLWSNDPAEVTRVVRGAGHPASPDPGRAWASWASSGRATAGSSTASPPTSTTPGEERHLSIFVLSGPARFRDTCGHGVAGRRGAAPAHPPESTVALVSGKARGRGGASARPSPTTVAAHLTPFPRSW